MSLCAVLYLPLLPTNHRWFDLLAEAMAEGSEEDDDEDEEEEEEDEELAGIARPDNVRFR